MAASEFNLSSLPEWYRIERETEKTIGRLTSLKELDYYISNPDEYIRRLAILRLQKVAAKDSVYILRDLLENVAETEENKLLASWALKTIVNRKDSDLFVSGKYLGKFSGSERYEDLFPISAEDISSGVRFDFSSSASYASLKLNNSDTAHERDVFFETDFDFKLWVSAFTSNLIKAFLGVFKAIGSIIFGIPVFMLKAMTKALKRLSQARQERKKIKAAKVRQPKERHVKEHKAEDHPHRKEAENKYPRRTDPSYDLNNLRREMARKPDVLSLVKKGVFQMLYLLFAPFRFVRKHKYTLLCFVLAAYLLLAYTDYGRAFSYKYFSVDLRNVPGIALQKARQYSTAMLAGLNKLTGIEEYKKNDPEAASKGILQASADVIKKAAEEGRLFLVTAQQGLNMRKSPDPGSEKIGVDPLPYGSTVIFLSKSENDKAGRTWYFVEAGDGRSGWVSAKFLKEKEG